MLTIPVTALPVIPLIADPVSYVKGQQEIGEGGYHHWQLLVITNRKCTIRQVKEHFCNEAHVELTRSEAANDYVWKEESRVPDTQFVYGFPYEVFVLI